MPKGLGLQNVRKFSWVKQPNGRYTIFSVPIFKSFADDKRGEVTLIDLQNIISNFEQDKMKNSRYPRIHIGHHENVENRPGAGYLDNFVLSNTTIFSDLVEITPEVFQNILQNLKYPYVSAEYNSERKKINSLALLESQSPYFQDFPLLALKDVPDEIKKYQRNFHMWTQRENIIKFQEGGCPCMDEEEKKEPEESPTEPKLPMIDTDEKKYKCQLEEAGLGEKLDRILSLIEEIHGWEKEEHEGGEEMGMEEDAGEENLFAPPEEPAGMPSEPAGPEESTMKKPSSVAFQQQQLGIKRMYKTMQDILKKLQVNEKKMQEDRVETQLREFCTANNLSFQQYLPILQKFSSASEKASAFETIKMSQKIGILPMQHPASYAAQKFQRKFPAKDSAEDKCVSKFSAGQQPLARRAYQTFQEITSAPNRQARNFQMAWQNVDTFVKYAVETPEFLESLTGEK